MRPRSTAERIERHLQRREKDRQRQAKQREVLRRAIEALRRRYPEVTQQRVASQCGVDRSMVAKLWTGAVTSNRVLIATIKAFIEAGWAPGREPVWARRAISALPPAEAREFAEWNFGAVTPGAKE